MVDFLIPIFFAKILKKIQELKKINGLLIKRCIIFFYPFNELSLPLNTELFQILRIFLPEF